MLPRVIVWQEWAHSEPPRTSMFCCGTGRDGVEQVASDTSSPRMVLRGQSVHPLNVSTPTGLQKCSCLFLPSLWCSIRLNFFVGHSEVTRVPATAVS